MPRRYPPSQYIPKSALKTSFVQHAILNLQSSVRKAPPPSQHAVVDRIQMGPWSFCWPRTGWGSTPLWQWDHIPGDGAVAILVEWPLSSEQKLRQFPRSENPLMVEGTGLLWSLGQYYFQSYSSAEICVKSCLQREGLCPRGWRMCLPWKAQGGLSSAADLCQGCASPPGFASPDELNCEGKEHHTDTIKGQRGQEGL